MNLELLRQVCVTPGAPGFEDKIRDFIIQEVAPLVDAVRVDNMGSVIAIVEGKNTEKTMMAAAHMDEIGFMVRHIDDKGFIKFLPLGGFDAKTLTAQRVIVHGKKDLIGVMGVKPIHVMSPAERTKLPEVTDFFIDLGMSKEEVEKYVSVGDSVTRERDLVEMGDCVNVKSLDNRAGCYVLIEALRAIKASRKKPSCNFVAAYALEGEWLPKQEAQQIHMALNYPIAELARRRPEMLISKNGERTWLDVTLHDLRDLHGLPTPLESLLGELDRHGFDIQGAWWELRTYRNKLSSLQARIKGLCLEVEDPQRYAV